MKELEDDNNSSGSFGDDFKQFNNVRTGLYQNGSSNEKPVEIVISDI